MTWTTESQTSTTTIAAESTADVEVFTTGDGRVVVMTRSTWADLTPTNANALATAISDAATLASGQ